MTEGVQIEQVKGEELTELSELALRTFTDAFGSAMDPEELSRCLEENMSVESFERIVKANTVLVAKQDNKIVGYVKYGPVTTPRLVATVNDREIGRLYVETHRQSRGIGKQLMDQALEDPELATAPKIFLTVFSKNQGAIRLYEGYNFQKCGVIEYVSAGKPAEDLIMVKHQSGEPSQLAEA